MEEVDRREPSIAHDLITLAAAVIVVIGMQQLSSILVPILTSIFFLLAFLPLVGWLQHKGVSRGWSKLIALASAGVALAGIVLLVAVSVSQLADDLPAYEDLLQERLQSLTGWLADIGINVSSDELSNELDLSLIVGLGVRQLPGIFAAIGGTLIALVVFVYALIDAEQMRQRLSRGLGADNPQVAQIARMVSIVSRYISIRAIMGGLTATLNVLLMFVLGVDYALFWGFVAFIMSFIPYVGYWISVVPPMLLALATHGWVEAAIVFAGYLVINGVIDNVVGPNMLGRGLNIAPTVTVISLVFWGIVLGPMGAILAMPLTVAFKLLLLERSPNSRWLAVLVSASDGANGVTPRSGHQPELDHATRAVPSGPDPARHDSTVSGNPAHVSRKGPS